MAKAFISLGSNINKSYYVPQGLSALENAFGELSLSSLFESEAIGFKGASFYNMVIGFETDVSLKEVTTVIRQIEFDNGRQADAKKYSPRTLDLDLLLFDNLIVEQPVVLPRAEICFNAFVLWPLAEIASEFIHPIENKTIGQMWQAFDKSSQKLKIVPLLWNKKVATKTT